MTKEEKVVILNTGINLSKIQGAQVQDDGVFIPRDSLYGKTDNLYFSVMLGKEDKFGGTVSIYTSEPTEEIGKNGKKLYKRHYMSTVGGKVGYTNVPGLQ